MTLHQRMKYLLKYMRKLLKEQYRVARNSIKRLKLWILIFIIGLLLDEYAKEGYFFNPYDILKPFTHEFLIVILSCIEIIIHILEWIIKHTRQ